MTKLLNYSYLDIIMTVLHIFKKEGHNENRTEQGILYAIRYLLLAQNGHYREMESIEQVLPFYYGKLYLKLFSPE